MVQISVTLAVLSSLVLCTNTISIDGSFCSEFNLTESIPDTILKTGTFYRVTADNTTNKFMTWSRKAQEKLGYRYIVTDECKRNRYTYEKGGQNYLHAQWFFLPAKGHSGWYHLVNRGIPGEFASWSYTSDENLSDEKHYMILDPYYSYTGENSPKLEYLFKPVRQGTSYQLKLKSQPEAYIGTTRIEEIPGADRWHLVLNSKEADAGQYKQDGNYFVSTLFNFEPITDVSHQESDVSHQESDVSHQESVVSHQESDVSHQEYLT